MVRFVVTVLAGMLLLGPFDVRAEEAAKPRKVSCKQIKEAIASGKTPQQVAAELGVREKRVKVCVSGRKKGKAKDGAKKTTAPQPTAAP